MVNIRYIHHSMICNYDEINIRVRLHFLQEVTNYLFIEILNEFNVLKNRLVDII